MKMNVLIVVGIVFGICFGCASTVQHQSSTGTNFVPSMSAGLEPRAVNAQPTTVQAQSVPFRTPLPLHLSAEEVSAEVERYAPAIESCYLKHLDDVRRAGRLDLTFVIGWDGHTVSLDVAVPGWSATAVEKMSDCVHDVVSVIRFPKRRFDTTAIVPYLFQHTNVSGGGPQLSCWKLKGCPEQHDK